MTKSRTSRLTHTSPHSSLKLSTSLRDQLMVSSTLMPLLRQWLQMEVSSATVHQQLLWLTAMVSTLLFNKLLKLLSHGITMLLSTLLKSPTQAHTLSARSSTDTTVQVKQPPLPLEHLFHSTHNSLKSTVTVSSLFQLTTKFTKQLNSTTTPQMLSILTYLD